MKDNIKVDLKINGRYGCGLVSFVLVQDFVIIEMGLRGV
jgi:hypothetical protein